MGIVEAESYPSIALVEGIPDFLAFYQVALSEEKLEKVAPVAMLGGGCSIDAQVIPRFKNKHVRIFAHADKAGLKSASKWQEQLKGVAAKLDFIDFSLLATSGRKTKDLCDYKDVHAAQ